LPSSWGRKEIRVVGGGGEEEWRRDGREGRRVGGEQGQGGERGREGETEFLLLLKILSRWTLYSKEDLAGVRAEPRAKGSRHEGYRRVQRRILRIMEKRAGKKKIRNRAWSKFQRSKIHDDTETRILGAESWENVDG